MDIARFRFKTLQARLLSLLLIPVVVILLLGGAASFWYARGIMLDQWRESAVVKLQRAAHYIEMRLLKPVDLLNVMFQVSDRNAAIVSPEQVVGFLQVMDGVVSAAYEPAESAPSINRNRMPEMGHMDRMNVDRHMGMRFSRSKIASVSGPRYHAEDDGRTVTMRITLSGPSQETLGHLAIRMEFDFLLKDILSLGWWQSDMACIVDETGTYMAHTNMTMTDRRTLGGSGDSLEQAILKKMDARASGTVIPGGHPPDMVAGFYKLDQVPWTIIMFADGHKILGSIVTYRNVLALGIFILAGLVLVLIRFHMCRMVNQIQQLSTKAEAVADGDYGDPIPVESRDEIGHLVESFNAMVTGLEERDHIRNSFGRYVDPEFARTLMAHPEAGQLGGSRREAVMLMSDIRGFTSLSETLGPEVIVSVLNRYFSHMIEIIREHQGIIVDFYGDAILVFFDPLDEPTSDTIHRAVQCAFHMQAVMPQVNRELKKQDLPDLSMGIGIHAGQVVVGNIGSDTRAKYGVVGPPVNMTARIQELAEKRQILISDAVLDQAAEEVKVLSSFPADLKGVDQAMTLHVIEPQNPPY
ncbi:MAG TPA: adenylate/guanylate cyclase domain-containing protein [Desulfotignum sp.]|nr:adenylate/guanylate cyclase domain-containing protein [Desulfotignum sp.]